MQQRIGNRFAVVLLSLMVGCSGGDDRMAVQGTVSLDGRPLESGSINFRPAANNQAPSSGGTIKQGGFALKAVQGLKPGDYLVAIQAFRKTGRTIDDPQMGKVEETKPATFRETMPLKASVVAGAENRFEFVLTSDSR